MIAYLEELERNVFFSYQFVSIRKDLMCRELRKSQKRVLLQVPVFLIIQNNIAWLVSLTMSYKLYILGILKSILDVNTLYDFFESRFCWHWRKKSFLNQSTQDHYYLFEGQ